MSTSSSRPFFCGMRASAYFATYRESEEASTGSPDSVRRSDATLRLTNPLPCDEVGTVVSGFEVSRMMSAKIVKLFCMNDANCVTYA